MTDNIKIEKRTVTVDSVGFMKELKELSQLYKSTNYGFNVAIINKELKCKLTFGDFVKICNDCGIKLYLGKVILFKDLEQF